MNLTLNSDWIMQSTVSFMLVSLRFFGLMLMAPMFAFRAAPMRLRLYTAILLGLAMMPMVGDGANKLGLTPPTFIAVAIELGIGVAMGFMVRISLVAIDLAAEILSIQTGLSFAASYVRDAALPSGIVGELMGITALALTLVFNVHLMLLDLIGQSFRVLPFGQWPKIWDAISIFNLMQASFLLGVILAMPMIVVHLLFYVIQAMLGRTSPQLNLFSVGFAVSVPLGLLVLVLVLPELPGLVQRALEPAFQLIRNGISPR
jgi:flagellar biosynthetic protein FliR